MERKIGEIFEYNGEWYQCVKGDICADCAFVKKHCNDSPLFKVIGNCNYRKDATSVIFNKLEKIGEPYVAYGKVRQQYKLHAPLTITNGIIDKDMSCDDVNLIVDIEFKQTKEDMEEKKLNLKPFDIQKAREGKPVCTRDGHKARIICFDKKGAYPIVALVNDYNEEEYIKNYDEFGKKIIGRETGDDLMMLSEKKEGWINVYKRESEYICENECNVSTGIAVYKSEGEAKRDIDKSAIYINTIKINWEE